jgi:hypothetical protein
MSSPLSLLAQWREANRSASEAEQAIFEASLMFDKGYGPEPTPEDRRRIQFLRTRASELLERAMTFGKAEPHAAT